MKCKFCGKLAEKILYQDASNYHIDSLEFAEDWSKERGIKLEMYFCLECIDKMDIDKYILFNSLNGYTCSENCLKKTLKNKR